MKPQYDEHGTNMVRSELTLHGGERRLSSEEIEASFGRTRAANPEIIEQHRKFTDWLKADWGDNMTSALAFYSKGAVADFILYAEDGKFRVTVQYEPYPQELGASVPGPG